jgi:hypothetical protein
VDRNELEAKLEDAFGGTQTQRRVISRQARDMVDSGDLAAEFDIEVTAETVVNNLQDAPEEYSLVERWNWWIGSLDLAHDGFLRFRVRPDVE